jgi:hypothetical protein
LVAVADKPVAYEVGDRVQSDRWFGGQFRGVITAVTTPHTYRMRDDGARNETIVTTDIIKPEEDEGGVAE